MALKDLPIQRKLMTVLLLTSGVVLLLTCAGFITYEVLTLRKNMVRGYTSRAEIVAANSSAALAFQDKTDALSVLAALKSDPRVVTACLYDNTGEVFATYPAEAPRELFPSAPEKPGHRFGPNELVIFSPVIQGDRLFGMVYLKSDLSSLTDRFRAYVLLVLGIISGSVIVAFFLSKTLQKQISGPILALAETAKAISDRNDYSVRAPQQGSDELGLLTAAFNRMLTQIHEQNQALSESEARVRAVLNSALSAVVVIDSEGRVTDWNIRAQTMFGWSRAEAVGRDLGELIVPAKYREGHRRGLARFFESGSGPVLNQLIEMPALHREGWEFPVELSISPLKTGDTITFCGFITDITERQEAAKQSAVFSRLGHSLSAVTSAVAAARVITEAADELIGWDACSLDLYDPEQNLIHPVLSIDTLEGRRQDVSPAYAGAPPSTRARQVLEEGRQLILRHPPFEFNDGGKPFGNTARPSASLMYVPIRRGESVMGLLSIQSYTPDAYDDRNLELLQVLADQCGGALERVRAEEKLRELNEQLERRVSDRTAQLEAVNRELEAFSYSVSHDLRAPLRHIDGFVDMLRQDAGDALGTTGKRYLTIISDAAKRMGALIDDLLVFSRMGRAELRRSMVRMDDLVAEVIREMASDFAGRNIEWDLGPLPSVDGDRSMFKQIWVNLIANAVKYSRDREVAKIKVFCRRNDTKEWEFAVQDNGAGFDMEYADKLFGVFQRLHQVEEFEGTGIGLANVRRIVQRHAGRTWAYGEVDRGATFYFTLPTAERSNP